MKALQRTLAILAAVFLLVQTVRHAYVLWLEPRVSVLDKYDRPLSEEIASSSLEDLVRRFDAVHKEAERARAEARTTDQRGSPQFEDPQREPFKSEQSLREAISGWEDRAKEVNALRFCCSVGFGFIVAGIASYRRLNPWAGVILLTVGFSVAVYWTSPAFRVVGAATREFDHLLLNKLGFSVASVLLLGFVVRALGVFRGGQSEP